METTEVVLVGGPSDGRRIRVRDLIERIQIPDPRPNPTWENVDSDIAFPQSIYVLTSLRFDDLPICIYAHAGLTMADAWHRLVHRYPQPNEREITNCIL